MLRRFITDEQIWDRDLDELVIGSANSLMDESWAKRRTPQDHMKRLTLRFYATFFSFVTLPASTHSTTKMLPS
jgi:hypothetical protein